MSYLVVKSIHISCVMFSVGLFSWRGTQHCLGRAWRSRWLGVAPHVVDTVLLSSAVALAVMLHQYPLVDGWLTAKVVALLAYIGLGRLALAEASSQRTRVLAFVAALGTVAYIVGVALTHSARWGVH